MPLSFQEPYLILCEGWADKGFFQRLFRERQLRNFEVYFPREEENEPGGWQKFGKYLFEIQVNASFEVVRKILVAADNDNLNRFSEIQGQVSRGGFNVPAAPLETIATNGLPDIAILMIPFDGSIGNLETFCLPAAYTRWPELQGPLSNYLNASCADTWDDRKQAKAKIQCLISATCQEDPTAPLSRLWTQMPEEYHIPVTDPCFDNITEFLRRFGQ
jgi:hypothetical protein